MSEELQTYDVVRRLVNSLGVSVRTLEREGYTDLAADDEALAAGLSWLAAHRPGPVLVDAIGDPRE